MSPIPTLLTVKNLTEYNRAHSAWFYKFYSDLSIINSITVQFMAFPRWFIPFSKAFASSSLSCLLVSGSSEKGSCHQGDFGTAVAVCFFVRVPRGWNSCRYNYWWPWIVTATNVWGSLRNDSKDWNGKEKNLQKQTNGSTYKLGGENQEDIIPRMS